MITSEHLCHWLGEIDYQVKSILIEINSQKVQMKGINVGLNGESWVSFEYLQEKAETIKQLINQVRYDMEHDVN